MHHPLIQNRSYSYHRDNWRPLFDKYNVSFTFAGHDHLYERSYPIINSSTLEYDDSEFYNYTDLDDTIYFTTGGAGAPLHNEHSNEFIAEKLEAYHFMLVDFEKSALKSTISLETWVMPNDFSNLYLYDNITISKYT